MKGALVVYGGTGELPAAGSFWWMHGAWYAMTPNGMLASLICHEVIEHGDGMITVSPSILTTGGELSWHGYLEQGVWRSV